MSVVKSHTAPEKIRCFSLGLLIAEWRMFGIFCPRKNGIRFVLSTCLISYHIKQVLVTSAISGRIKEVEIKFWWCGNGRIIWWYHWGVFIPSQSPSLIGPGLFSGAVSFREGYIPSPFLERKPPLVFLRPVGLAKVELEKQDLGFKDGVEPPFSNGPKKESLAVLKLRSSSSSSQELKRPLLEDPLIGSEGPNLCCWCSSFTSVGFVEILVYPVLPEL